MKATEWKRTRKRRQNIESTYLIAVFCHWFFTRKYIVRSPFLASYLLGLHGCWSKFSVILGGYRSRRSKWPNGSLMERVTVEPPAERKKSYGQIFSSREALEANYMGCSSWIARVTRVSFGCVCGHNTSTYTKYIERRPFNALSEMSDNHCQWNVIFLKNNMSLVPLRCDDSTETVIFFDRTETAWN